jgi:competence protein ComEC
MKHSSIPAAVSAVAMMGLAACSSGVSPGAAPTAQTAATQAAPTVQALATSGATAAQQAAPTVQALATSASTNAAQSAPTLQALATQVAPVSATVTSNAPVRISNVQSTSNDASMTVQNSSNSAVDMSGWTLMVGTSTVSLPSGVNIPPGGTIILHTGSGTNSASDVYLGSSASTLAQQVKPGARIVLQNPSGSPTTAFVVPGA